jgi:hypothetical protein
MFNPCLNSLSLIIIIAKIGFRCLFVYIKRYINLFFIFDTSTSSIDDCTLILIITTYKVTSKPR